MGSLLVRLHSVLSLVAFRFFKVILSTRIEHAWLWVLLVLVSLLLASLVLIVVRASASSIWRAKRLIFAKGTFLERLNKRLVVAFLELVLELAGNVHQVSWVDEGASVQLTLSIDAITLNELLIKHDNNLLLSLSNDRSTSAVRDVESLDRTHVEHSVANLELISSVLGEHA